MIKFLYICTDCELLNHVMAFSSHQRRKHRCQTHCRDIGHSLLFAIPSSVFRSILMSILTRLHCFIPPINGELSVCHPNYCIANLCILADFRLDLKRTNHWHSQINSIYGGQKTCSCEYVRKKGKGKKNHIYIKQNQ